MSRPLLLKLSSLVALFVIFAFLNRHLALKEDVTDLLPDSDAKGALGMIKASGALNRILIVVEGDSENKGLTIRTSRAIIAALSRNQEFVDVAGTMTDESMVHLADAVMMHYPAYLDTKDMAELQGHLSLPGIEKYLRRCLSLLMLPGDVFLKNMISRDPLGLFQLYLEKLKHFMPPGGKMTYKDGLLWAKCENAILIIAKSARPLSDSAYALKVYGTIQRILTKDVTRGCTVTVLGPLVHTISNHKAIRKDLAMLLPITSICVMLILWFFFRGLRGFILLSIPFLASTPAIFFTGMVSGGTLRTIAIGFGIVLIGIAVDFAVHLHVVFASTNRKSIWQAFNLVKRPFLTAVLTTLAVFVTLLFSSIPSHRQMAILAISGLLLALVYAFWIVPELPVGDQRGMRKPRGLPAFLNTDNKNRWILCLWTLFVASGVFCWWDARFNTDISQFDYVTAPIRSAEEKLRRLFGIGEPQIILLVNGRAPGMALNKNDRLFFYLCASGLKKDVRSLASVLPGPMTQQRNIERWRMFWTKRRASFIHDFMKKAEELGFSIRAFSPFLKWLSSNFTPLTDRELMELFKNPVFKNLIEMPLAKNTLSSGVKFTIFTYLPENQETIKKVSEIKNKLPGVYIVSKKWMDKGLNTSLSKELRRLGLVAFLLMLLIVMACYRSWNIFSILGVFAPLLSAFSAMGIYAVVCGTGLNPIHCLTAIMVAGLSIDYGVFCSSTVSKIEPSVRSAVLACALTTLSGFGVLALATHPALRSIGQTTLIGIGAALPSALLVSPVLSKMGEKRGAHESF